MPIKRPAQLVLASALLSLTALAFQNCGSSLPSNLDSSSTQSAMQLLPQAQVMGINSKVSFTVGANSTQPLQLVNGSGLGSVYPSNHSFSSYGQSGDAVVGITDAAGNWLYSFIKILSSSSPMAMVPAAAAMPAGGSVQLQVIAGSPPFTFAVSSGLGQVDPNSGLYTAGAGSGTATVTVTDFSGKTENAYIQYSSSYQRVMNVMDSPNPAITNETVALFASGGVSPYSFVGTGVMGSTVTTGAAPTSIMITASDASGERVSFPLVVHDPTYLSGITCTHGSQIFSYTGADQSFTAPLGCPSINVKLWGAGGGYGGYGSTTTRGGGGGFTSGAIAITSAQVFTIIVGQGGPSPSGVEGVSGGGRSAIQLTGTELITAGGGGGSGSGNGGDGGGLIGSDGGSSGGYIGGKGGSQTAGGADGGAGSANICGDQGSSVAGSQFTGGRGVGSGQDTPATYGGGGSGWGLCGGSGGGGGYFGGGGGMGNYAVIGPGGGGSSYYGGPGVSGGATVAGSAGTPGESSDSNYVAGVGVGGSSSHSTSPTGGSADGNGNVNGGNGQVVISW